MTTAQMTATPAIEKNIFQNQLITLREQCAQICDNQSSPEYLNNADVCAHRIRELPLPQITIPRIGTHWVEHGGIFAGIVAGENNAPDYFLIHATSGHELVDIDWHNSIEASQAPINGLTDWSLPDTREARLLAINCRDSFDLDSFYWTSKQHAHGGRYAWMQDFDDGTQASSLKSYKYRARAVRRVFIIQ